MNIPLTKEEADFAAENHNLIYSFLNRRHLPESEFYDVAVFGYLRAVHNYFTREDLRDTYAFSTIAYSSMRTDISNHFRAGNRLKRRAEVLQYDEDADVLCYEDNVLERVDQNHASQRAREKLSEVLTPRQNNVIYMKAGGHTYREISEKHGMSKSSVGRELKSAGNAVRNHAPELIELIAA